MRYIIFGSIGFVAGVVGGFLGAKVKEWVDLREIKKMMNAEDENCSGDCSTCGGCEDGWDGK